MTKNDKKWLILAKRDNVPNYEGSKSQNFPLVFEKLQDPTTQKNWNSHSVREGDGWWEIE